MRKTARVFSSIATSQAHEQYNATVKGGVGLTESPAALRRWMLFGPEMSRVIDEFELPVQNRKEPDLRHRDQETTCAGRFPS